MPYALSMKMDNADTSITRKNKNLFRYYFWRIKMEVSKRCVVTQSAYGMQPYPSL